MKDGPNIARIASLLGDPARADALTALMADRALTATELSAIAGVTKQTMSAHLSKLVDARLVAVDPLGRHRYFRLADGDVADLLESLMGVAFRTGAVRLLASRRCARRASATTIWPASSVSGHSRGCSRAAYLRAPATASRSPTQAGAGSRASASTAAPSPRSAVPSAVLAWTGASGASILRALWDARSSRASASSSGRGARRARASSVSRRAGS